MLEQPTQPLAANDILQANRFTFGRRLIRRRRQMIATLVRTRLIIEGT
jgi:hypothetical protein